MRSIVFTLLALACSGAAADHFTGMVSCASSGCHGGGKDKNQCLIWRQRDPVTGKTDPHHTAPDILSAARSAEIAKALGIADATKDAHCTTCHSPMESVPARRLLKDVKPDRGVSCEACHGAAESWLRFHTRLDISHEQRVSAGLKDLRTAYNRANTCAGCHVNINPELVKAKHPELKFDLARQNSELPKHWKEIHDPAVANLWLTGQATVLREWSWKLSKAADADLVPRWRALYWLLKKTPIGDRILTAPPATPTAAEFAETQRAADKLARAASNEKFTDESTQRLYLTLTALADEFHGQAVDPYELKHRGQLLSFALADLAPREKSGQLSPAAQEKLTALRELLKPGVPFDGDKFAAAVVEFKAAAK